LISLSFGILLLLLLRTPYRCGSQPTPAPQTTPAQGGDHFGLRAAGMAVDKDFALANIY